MRALCPLCRWSASQFANVAGKFVVHLACRQGMPGAPLRLACSVFMREPGADDEFRPRRRGRWHVVGVAT